MRWWPWFVILGLIARRVVGPDERMQSGLQKTERKRFDHGEILGYARITLFSILLMSGQIGIDDAGWEMRIYLYNFG
jgi:hypothetical protein